MANIWGMEDVLSDRCITLILDKSSKQHITRLLEIFDKEPLIIDLKVRLTKIQCSLCSVVMSQNIYIGWNKYIISHYNNTTTHTTLQHTNYTKLHQDSEDISEKNILLFDKIIKTSLDSRHLELFFPLFILAELCDVLDETILSAEDISKIKKGDDMTENKDISLIDFISREQETILFQSIKVLTRRFKEFLDEDEEEARHTNPKWVGRVLKRLNLIKEKRRMGNGVEIVIDYGKAQEKIRLFKVADPSIEEEMNTWEHLAVTAMILVVLLAVGVLMVHYTD